MGIRFYCPNGHKLNVKGFQAGRKGICPYCGSKFFIPSQSTRKSSKEERAALRALATASPVINAGSQNVASGVSANMPAFPTQTSPLNPSASHPNINPSKTDAELSTPTAIVSSQQIVGGTEASSPILPNSTGYTPYSDKTMPSANPSTGTTSGPTADPLDTAGDVVWYVRPPSGGQFGPATSKIMRQWLAQGRIGPDSLIWHEGWRDWQQASAVFSQLRMNDPMAEIANIDTPFVKPISLVFNKTQRHGPFQKRQLLVIVIGILIVIIITSILFWAFNRGSDSATDNSAATSTRLDIRDTLSPSSFL